MKRLSYIEDYIDLIGGGALFWPPRDPIIKLARYDEPIVQSMADQISRSVGFTDRQSALAHKIVIKYRKQWEKAGYDVSHHIDAPKFKLPIRQIDRRRLIDIIDNKIQIRFPYDQEIISRLRADIQNIPGKCTWQAEKHCWESALIEPRLIWAKEFGLNNNFEFGHDFDHVLKTVLTTCMDYSIELQQDGSVYTITNAESSMVDYINQHVGFDNVMGLLDHSPILSYGVDHDIVESLTQNYSKDIVDLLLSKTVNMTFRDEITNFDQVLKYAEVTKRYPIYVFETGSKKLYNKIHTLIDKNDIVSTGHHLLDPEESKQAKVIYLSHWRNITEPMPLFVTMHTFVIGNRRQWVANQAEKIVYYTQIVDQEQ